MISFIIRLAVKALVVQKYRFISLTLTLAVASSLLIILSGLYFNAESQMAMELSGVPNMVVEPKKNIVKTSSLNFDDIKQLKSEDHFWRNNVVTAAPVMYSETSDDNTKLAGTWFKEQINVNNEKFTFGLLTFSGWEFNPVKDNLNGVILGANREYSDSIVVDISGQEVVFPVAGTIKTGSYWDDYIFMEVDRLSDITGEAKVDEILVSALIKPKDKLAFRVEQYGEESLNKDEFEKWYCSPYPNTVAYTIEEVIPNGQVNILRRITEVQEGIIQASAGVFFALFILTLAAAFTAILSAEKMYVASHLKDFGIMAAMGASRKKIFLQLLLEIIVAAVISGIIAFILSKLLVGYISIAVFGIEFKTNVTLMAASIAIPFLVSISALFMVRKSLRKDVKELLR